MNRGLNKLCNALHIIVTLWRTTHPSGFKWSTAIHAPTTGVYPYDSIHIEMSYKLVMEISFNSSTRYGSKGNSPRISYVLWKVYCRNVVNSGLILIHWEISMKE